MKELKSPELQNIVSHWQREHKRRSNLRLKPEQIQLTERDSLRVLDLLGHPPTPNARLRAAAQLLPPSP
ncbi:MAG: DUF1778 domain-containing protein [Candidatus Sericytochromatia bacterium]